METLTLEQVMVMPEDALAVLAKRLKPYAEVGFTVKLERLHRIADQKTLCYADLAFYSGTVCTGRVPGFRLKLNDNGSRWLAEPQHKDKNGQWVNNYDFGGREVKEEARKVVCTAYDLMEEAS